MRNYIMNSRNILYRIWLKFDDDQKGITSIEYGLIAIALATFCIIILYGDKGMIGALEGKFTQLASVVTSAILSS